MKVPVAEPSGGTRNILHAVGEALPSLRVGEAMGQDFRGVVRWQDGDAREVAEGDDQEEALPSGPHAVGLDDAVVEGEAGEEVLKGLPKGEGARGPPLSTSVG